MDDVHRRLGAEVTAVPLRRPRAAVVDRAPGGGGEAAHPVDLYIGELLPGHRGIDLVGFDHHVVARRLAHFAARQRVFRQQRLHEQFAARRLRPHHAIVVRDFQAPRVAALRRILLNRGAIRLEPHHPAADAAEILRAFAIQRRGRSRCSRAWRRSSRPSPSADC